MANRALLVGINKYQIPGANLAGCVNDISNMRKTLLAYFGFKAEEISTLTDEQATKKNLLEGLELLVDGAKKGDRLLFHFSGHGSQVPDQNGEKARKLWMKLSALIIWIGTAPSLWMMTSKISYLLSLMAVP